MSATWRRSRNVVVSLRLVITEAAPSVCETSAKAIFTMKKGRVEPIKGEPNRYYVDSYGSSHDSVERYLVDMSLKDFGCGCANFDFRLRPLWKQMRATGAKPNAAVYCKHIRDVVDYRAKWERIEANAEAMIGQIALFSLGGKWLAGEVEKAIPAQPERQKLEPDFALTVRGRSGRTAEIEKIANQVFLCLSWAEAEAYLSQLN